MTTDTCMAQVGLSTAKGTEIAPTGQPTKIQVVLEYQGRQAEKDLISDV